MQVLWTKQWPLTLNTVNLSDKTKVWQTEPNIYDQSFYFKVGRVYKWLIKHIRNEMKA